MIRIIQYSLSFVSVSLIILTRQVAKTMKNLRVFLVLMLFVNYSKAQENSTETTNKSEETTEVTSESAILLNSTKEMPKIFKKISNGYQCREYNQIILKEENDEIECKLKNLNVNSLNRHTFKLDLDETLIARTLGLPSDFFIETENHRHYITQIRIENSQIKMIPDKLFIELPKLRILQIMNVGVRSLFPETFKNALDLKQLQLYGNQLKRLSSYTFIHAENLLSIDASNNHISNIQSKAFYGLEKLEKISLDNNEISMLNDEVFLPLISLQEIYLGKNKLTIIPAQLFSSVHNQLQKIFLNNNKINDISYYAFHELPKLRFLNLEGNNCVNKNFVNHKITENSAVQLELKKCVKNFNKVLNDDHKILKKLKEDLRSFEVALWKLKRKEQNDKCE